MGQSLSTNILSHSERWVMYETNTFPECCVDFCFDSSTVSYVVDVVGHNYSHLAIAKQLGTVFDAFSDDIITQNKDSMVDRIHQLSSEVEHVGRSATLAICWVDRQQIKCINIGDGALIARIDGKLQLLRGFHDDTSSMELAGDIRGLEVFEVYLSSNDFILGLTDGILDLLSKRQKDVTFLLENLNEAIGEACTPVSICSNIKEWCLLNPPQNPKKADDCACFVMINKKHL